MVVSQASPVLERNSSPRYPSPQNVVQEGNWVSEDDLFEDTEVTSMHSSERDRSLENITQRKSRVSSTENGKNCARHEGLIRIVG